MLENLIGPSRDLTWALKFWPVLVSSFIAALVATWACKSIALKFGIVDKPDDTVKTHKKPVAYLGGIGILAGLFVGILTGLYIVHSHEQFGLIFKWMLGIIGGAMIACLIGLLDDLVDIKPSQKIMGQILAAMMLIVVGIKPALAHFTSPLGIELAKTIETILEMMVIVIFVVGATNSLNLLDGLDGLCAGVTTVITIAMLILAVHLATWGFSEVGDPVRVILCVGLVGSVGGFLPFNRHPAKIFMGDAGSMLLGFCAATLMILFGEKIPRWWMASIVVFGLPILDTAVAFARRIINKRPIFVSDRGHIYDQMIDRGMSLKQTVLICYILAGVYAAVGLLMSQTRTRYALVIYILVFVVSGLVVWKKGYLKMEGLRGKKR